MEKISPERYVGEMIIAGLMGALVKSKAVKPKVFEDYVTAPLYHHYRLQYTCAEKADNEVDRKWHTAVEIECAQWHSYLVNVINSLK